MIIRAKRKLLFQGKELTERQQANTELNLAEIDKKYSNDIYLASVLKLYTNLILKCPKQAATKNKFITLFQISDKHIEFIHNFFKENVYKLGHPEHS